MGGGNIQLTEKQQEMARRSYELYAKQAPWTFNRTLFELGKMAAAFVITAFNLAALVVMLAGADRLFLGLKIVLTGIIAGAITGQYMRFISEQRHIRVKCQGWSVLRAIPKAFFRQLRLQMLLKDLQSL